MTPGVPVSSQVCILGPSAPQQAAAAACSTVRWCQDANLTGNWHAGESCDLIPSSATERCHSNRYLRGDVALRTTDYRHWQDLPMKMRIRLSTRRMVSSFRAVSSAHTSRSAFGGTTSADDFETGTRAAAFGGTTTLIDFAIQYKGQSLRTHSIRDEKKAEAEP